MLLGNLACSGQAQKNELLQADTAAKASITPL